MPKAFVKHRIASPPIVTREAIDDKIRREKEKLSDFSPANRPEKMRNSDMKPFRGGSPQIARAAIKNKAAV